MLNSEVLCALPHNELMRTLAMSTSILRRCVTDGQGMKWMSVKKQDYRSGTASPQRLVRASSLVLLATLPRSCGRWQHNEACCQRIPRTRE